MGSITGGEKDESAPRPIADKVDPPNASVDFVGKKVIIPFDEYFTLSSPTTSIQMVPPHAKVNATMKGTPAVSTARRQSWMRSTDRSMGFSQKMAFPAAAA